MYARAGSTLQISHRSDSDNSLPYYFPRGLEKSAQGKTCNTAVNCKSFRASSAESRYVRKAAPAATARQTVRNVPNDSVSPHT